MLIGGGLLVASLVRAYWPRVVQLVGRGEGGGAILGHPRAYFTGVVPARSCQLDRDAVRDRRFLAAYAIPVTFDTLMHVVGGNSIANVTSVTPGGVGVTQAFNVASLKESRPRRTRLLTRSRSN